jgi:thiosulfate dehydrogenase [quinone] large subunit
MSAPSSRSRSAPGARSHGGVRPRAALVALLFLRVFTGLFFLDVADYKLREVPASKGLGFAAGIEAFREDEYVPMVEEAIADPPTVFGRPFTAYADYLREVMLPAKEFVAPAILIGEALLGVALVLGAFVRLAGVLGALMMAAFAAAKHNYLFTTSSANWAMTAILLALAIAAAGRFVGMDAWLRPRLPRLLAWVS